MNQAADPISKEAFEAATTAIRATISEGDGPLPPHFVVEFLLRSWRRYLAIVHEQGGGPTGEWREAMEVTRRLVQSLRPPVGSRERATLTQSLPRLVADLKIGAALAGMPAGERDAFLSALREFHLRLLDPSSAPRVKEAGDEPSDTITMDTRDPRMRSLLDKLDGADGVEHIEM